MPVTSCSSSHTKTHFKKHVIITTIITCTARQTRCRDQKGSECKIPSGEATSLTTEMECYFLQKGLLDYVHASITMHECTKFSHAKHF